MATDLAAQVPRWRRCGAHLPGDEGSGRIHPDGDTLGAFVGGINLEDIAQPKCFGILAVLRKEWGFRSDMTVSKGPARCSWTGY
jgi:hypothetical protein